MKKYLIVTSDKQQKVAAEVIASSKVEAEQLFNAASAHPNERNLGVTLLDVEQRGDYKAVVA